MNRTATTFCAILQDNVMLSFISITEWVKVMSKEMSKALEKADDDKCENTLNL